MELTATHSLIRMPALTMDEITSRRFRRLIYEVSGIALNDTKDALVCARIAKRMRALSIDRYRDYLKYVTQDSSGKELVHLVDAISTNSTSFLREADHFETLRELFTERLEKGQQRRFRFWSAACSTGEEPYSMALTLLDAANGLPLDMRLLATDINTKVLATALRGLYSGQRIITLPKSWMTDYFDKKETDDGINYQVVDAVKKIISFNRINLSKPPFPMQGPFDAVFCRYVMIYFSQAVREALLNDIARLTRKGSLLFVGHSESLTGMSTPFRCIRPSVYVRE